MYTKIGMLVRLVRSNSLTSEMISAEMSLSFSDSVSIPSPCKILYIYKSLKVPLLASLNEE